MSKRTLLLIFLLFIVAFVLTITFLYKPSFKDSLFLPIPTPSSAVPQTTLSFGNLISPLITTYQLPILISTRDNKVTAVQIELSYDPNVLKKVNIIPGPFFKNPVILLNKIDENDGRISYALGIEKDSKSGEGVVAVLIFESPLSKRQETFLSFLPKTSAAALELVRSALIKASSSAKIIVGVDN